MSIQGRIQKKVRKVYIWGGYFEVGCIYVEFNL